MTIQFAKFTVSEAKHVMTIINRAYDIYLQNGLDIDKQDLEMGLSATHATCPLDLERMSQADDFNLMHDITGIGRHLNRRTGELENFFVPRYAQPEVTDQDLIENGLLTDDQIWNLYDGA